MAIAAHSNTSVDEVNRLRAQIERMRAPRVHTPTLPTHPLLADLLPEGGLRSGATYAVSGSMSLMLALLAPVSQDGSWCAAIGVPELGVEAAAAFGVELSRFVLIPDPGSRWLAVTSAVAEVLPLVAVRPQGRVGDADISRLSARLRDRGTTLLVQGGWPQADALLSIQEPAWTGLGDGHGYLAEREVTITVSSRRAPRPRSARMLLPDRSGRLSAAVRPRPSVFDRPGLTPVDAQQSPRPRHLEAVG